MSEIGAWKSELHRHPSTARTARLEINLGECAMARDQNPDLGLWRFTRALSSAPADSSLHNLAEYDRAIALFHQGAFAASERAFAALLSQHSPAGGFDRKECSLWYRHAQVHADYHRERARIGIPEPPRLDPLSGPASLSTCLRSLGLPWSKAKVLSLCPVTGIGAAGYHLALAAEKLGACVHAVAFDDRGLMRLPKPLICVVEKDHYIAVTQADRRGVTYLCSDCGPYPGGGVRLSWAQWHKMDNSGCLTVTRPHSSAEARLLAMLGRPTGTVKVASAGSLSGLLPALNAIGSIRLLSINPNSPTTCPVCTPELLYGACEGCGLHCTSCTPCPFDSGGSGGGGGAPGGPGFGDPVNLADGEEEYSPPADLTVYNPTGPSVTWQRNYGSLRTAAGNAPAADFGVGWSQPYNIGVFDAASGGSGTKYLVEANGARISFSAPSVPTAASPTVSCTVQAGYPFLVTWNYNGTTAGYYTVTFANRTKYTTLNPVSATEFTNHQWCPAGQITDRNSNSINLNYDSTSTWLSSITDGGGAALLTITRDSNGYITAVSDRYNRSIYYAAATGSYPLLGTVSQVVATGTVNPPARYTLTYATVSTAPQLHSITVPSATGTGNATATIDYDALSGQVTDIVDANGNKHAYSAGTGSATTVNMTDGYGVTIYTYSASYDSNMSQTGETDGAGKQTVSYSYQDPNDPLRPSKIVSGDSVSSTNPPVSQSAVGNLTVTGADAPAAGSAWDVVVKSGNVTLPIATSTSPAGWSVSYATSLSVTVPAAAVVDNNYEVRYNTGAGYKSAYLDVTTAGGMRKETIQQTWDRYGNQLSEANARGTTTTYTWSYTNFALGELASVKEGSKSATSFTYYEPSGLRQSFSIPLPGTAGGAQIVTTSFTYNSLGDVVTLTTPGNNSATSILTTDNFTADGSYNQSAAINEPLTETDKLGKVYHFRYDSRGNLSSVVDPLGNECDYSYNLADQLTTTTFPATGQTGTGRASVSRSFLYVGGPSTGVNYYDESGAQVRQLALTLGREGELLSRSGDTEPVTYQYDGKYRVTNLSDGNGHSATCQFNGAGYITQITHPLGDKIQYTGYNADGEVMSRLDGNNVETDVVYHDPGGRPTDIRYAATPATNVHVVYDGYARRSR